MAEKLAVGVNEAAELLGVGRDVVYQLVNSGRLRSFKLNARRLIAVADLREFVERESSLASEAAAVR